MKLPSTSGFLFVMALFNCNVASAGDADYLPGFMIEIELEAHKAG